MHDQPIAPGLVASVQVAQAPRTQPVAVTRPSLWSKLTKYSALGGVGAPVQACPLFEKLVQRHFEPSGLKSQTLTRLTPSVRASAAR